MASNVALLKLKTRQQHATSNPINVHMYHQNHQTPTIVANPTNPILVAKMSLSQDSTLSNSSFIIKKTKTKRNIHNHDVR